LKKYESETLIVYGIKLFKEFQANKSKKLTLGIYHGSYIPNIVGNIKDHETIILKKDVENSKLDYLALGHFHDFIKLNTKVKATYSGSPIKELKFRTALRTFNLITAKNKKVKVRRIKIK